MGFSHGSLVGCSRLEKSSEWVAKHNQTGSQKSLTSGWKIYTAWKKNLCEWINDLFPLLWFHRLRKQLLKNYSSLGKTLLNGLRVKNAYTSSVKKFSSPEIAWAKHKDENNIFALVMHVRCEICIARKRKLMWQVMQQPVQLNYYHVGMPLRCSHKWRDNRQCKQVFTRRMQLLSWCERWSVLPAIFGEARIVGC